jgi:tRNA(Arg) A34 adenosine deaminase TadA
MKLTTKLEAKLVKAMQQSALKGNLANAGAVLSKQGKLLAIAESWVVSSHDATAHSERMLVERICHQRGTNFTAGLTMLTVVEPCTMCLSACSQAGYESVAYILPADNYVAQVPWVTDGITIDKMRLAKQFSNPIKLIWLEDYTKKFAQIFEKAMYLDA